MKQVDCSSKARRVVAKREHLDLQPTFCNWRKSNNLLAPNYVPSIFPNTRSPAKRKIERDTERFEQRQITKRRRLMSTEKSIVDNGRAQTNNSGNKNDDVQRQDCDVNRVESQGETTDSAGSADQNKTSENTDDDGEDNADNRCAQCSELQKRCDQYERENKRLSSKVINDKFLEDDEEVKYAGLQSYELLQIIYHFVICGLPQSIHNGPCSAFQQFLMVLMKLHLNLRNQDLAYRFGVHQSTVSRYFNRWLDILYNRLSVLVSWPEREVVLKTMPMEFCKKFRKCAIIINCFEIFIERPTSITARAQTWSNYKKHNTVKFLIGITPQGSISFNSKGWGGRVSDVYLTEHSGLLQNLLPGDVILADRGFTIQESVGMLCAEVKIPPFTKGKKQLSKLEVDTTHELSQVRIHVERVIRMVWQKFTILQSTLPITMIMCNEDEEVSSINKIVTICCALCNHYEPVVLFN